MLSHKGSDKARHYVDLLDDARCSGRWSETPELVRKVRKHAPQRSCLTLTAQTECRIATHSSQRPATASSSPTSLAQAIPPLLTAIEKENAFREDAFQAQVCLSWLHTTLGEPGLAITRLPPSLDKAAERLRKDGGITARWTHVCIVKGAYIHGVSLESSGNPKEAAQAYASMLPYISSMQASLGTTPEYRLWTERLLARHCMLSSRYITANAHDPHCLLSFASTFDSLVTLAPFRTWAEFFVDRQSRNAGLPNGKDGQNSISETRLWQAYYDALSVLIQQGIVQPVFPSRTLQSAEFKKVEAIYEAILLKDVRFPKANRANTEIESWVDQVMANWRAMHGPHWQQEDFGEGGKAALNRSVLDVLYRAATRSFHSTRILRHLFIVHSSMADLNLAFKALDSYLEILMKGKARVEKSGEAEPGLDDDTTALCAGAAGIKLLCFYGRREEAEKALGIAGNMETWLRKCQHGLSPDTGTSTEEISELVEKPKSPQQPVAGKALAIGYQAIGVSQSCWARLTYESSSRSDLQARAIANFRVALTPKFGEQENIESLYYLASALADTRDIDAAIGTIKQAVTIGTKDPSFHSISQTDAPNDDDKEQADLDTDRRRTLLRCWHLLVLLLSAKQNFSTASASCEAAFEPYGGKATLYGDTKFLSSVKSLSMSERDDLIEFKMTHLALSEVIDGSEEAINASGELLSLYTKLFNYWEQAVPKSLEPKPASPTANSNGAARSFRGSILGLQKDARKSLLTTGGTASNSVRSFEPSNEKISAPGISVTSDGLPLPQNHSPNHTHFLGRHESKKLRKRNSKKSLGSVRRSRAGSPSKASSVGGPHLPTLNVPVRDRSLEINDPSHREATKYASDEVGVAISHDTPTTPSASATTSDPHNPIHIIPSATQNMNHENPNTHPIAPRPPSMQSHHLHSTSVFAATTLPEPIYPPHAQTRHVHTVLTKIWLFISSLYRRSSLPLDAHGAVREATTQVQSVETSIANLEGSSARNFLQPGYGGLKSLGELWADVLAEKAASYEAQVEMGKATEAYETALSWWPDHVDATVGLSNILLDSYAQFRTPQPVSSMNLGPAAPTLGALPSALPSLETKATDVTETSNAMSTTSPSLLSRLAARDRAYGLLSGLTKSGAGWDCSEAWYALARAYEESGQTEKAKEALWWVVELEEGKGLRPRRCIV